MWKLIYSIIISLAFLLFSFYYTKTIEINEEYLFFIGVITIPLFYNLVYLPIWFFINNKVFTRRLFAYFICCICSSIIFSVTYMNLSGISNGFFLSVVNPSFKLFFVASTLYFLPIELSNFSKRNDIVTNIKNN